MDKVIIIAEAGVNHNGDINLAQKLVDVAAEAGADYIKFQTFRCLNHFVIPRLDTNYLPKSENATTNKWLI